MTKHTANPYKAGHPHAQAFEEMREEYPDWILSAVVTLSRHGLMPGEPHHLDEAATYILNAHNGA